MRDVERLKCVSKFSDTVILARPDDYKIELKIQITGNKPAPPSGTSCYICDAV